MNMRFLKFFLYVLLLASSNIFAQEGTKQFMPNESDRLWLEMYRGSDKHFATYSADDKERLYIYLNAGETMHFGMKMANSGGEYRSWKADYTSFRIKNETGSVVYSERAFPKSGNGYISAYSAAVNGPNGVTLNGTEITNGYNAQTYTALTSGNHYIEFETWAYSYGTGGNYAYNRRFAVEFFDVTVTDASNNVITNSGNPNISAGRLWSRGWAFTTTSFNNYPVKTNFYVFTADEFVNKVQYEMKPYSFNFVANSYGVSLDVNDNVIQKAQSVDGDATNTDNISEYRIFLNDPDRVVWQNTALPPPTVQVWFDDDLLFDYDYDRNPQELSITPSTIVLERNMDACAYESITMFKIASNIDGFATILLDLDGNGYSTSGSDRALQLDLKQGENFVLWDFKNDNGVEVNDGVYSASATFLGRGPAHFPLYDVESLSGISTYSIRPFNKLGPTLYWDDTNVGLWGDQGSGTMAETAQDQLVINNHIPRVWTYNGNNYNGNNTTFNSWFNAIDLGMSTINFEVTTSTTKCVNGEAPVIGNVIKVGAINEVLTFALSDFSDKYYDPNDLPLTMIEVVNIPSQGELRVNGSLVSDGQEITAADIPNLTYTPVNDFGGTIQFEFKASNVDNYSLQSNYVNLVSNTAPTIGAIGDENICTNTGLTNHPITVGDGAETPAEDLTVIAYSHDPAFVENNNIEVTGTGATRYLNITPVNDQSGFAIIYVLVDDGYSQTIEEFAIYVGPSVVINGDMSVCINGDLLLTAEEIGASTYEWKKGETTLSTSNQLDIQNVSLADAGIYSLTVTTDECSTTKDFVVSIAPSTDFTGDVDVCVGETLSLSADETVATSYAWYRGSTQIGSQKVLEIPNMTLGHDDSNYTLYVEKEGCSHTSQAFSVSVVQMLDANLSITGSNVLEGNVGTITITSAEQDITYSALDGNGDVIDSGSNATAGNDLVLTIPVSSLTASSNVFTITGDNGNCTVNMNNTATIGVNLIPTVSSLTETTAEDTDLVGNLLSGASDDDGGNLSTSLAGGGDPSNGTLVINSDGSFTYTPNANFNGSDSFSFEVCDDQTPQACVTADVNITVTATNDPPRITVTSSNGTEDNNLIFAASNFTDAFTDVENDALSQIRIDAVPNASTGELQLSGVPISNGQVIDAANLGSITFVPSANWNGATAFSWSASDGEFWSGSESFSLNVSAADDDPNIQNQTASVNEDAIDGTSIININDGLTGTDNDIDGEPINYSIISGNTGSVFSIHPTSGLITVNNSASIDFETTEQYSLVIRAIDSQLSSTDATITINVNNTDSDVVLTIADAALTEGTGGNTNLVFTISSSSIVAGDVSVDFDITDVSTSYPADYTLNSGTATITTGNNTTTIAISIVGDVIVENIETFRVDLSAPTAGTVSGHAIGTINDNDTASLSVANASANEGDGTIDFVVTLNGTVANAFDVTYNLTNGTGIGGQDFNASSGTINFTGVNGQTRTIQIPLTDDAIVELNETFTLGLSTANTAIDASDTAEGTISDNDGVAVLSIANASFDENGSGTFRITADKAVQGGYSVTYNLVNGTAIGGTDFTVSANRTLNFAGSANEYQEFTISGIDDAIVEGNETFTLNMTDSHVSVQSTATATGTIIDDDAVNVTIDDVTVTEGGSANFTITLNNAVVGGTSITVNFSDISATGGSDYTNTAQTVVFAGTAGETESISVPTTNDDVVEASETFELSMTSSNALVGADDRAIVTINDNDGLAMVTVADVSINENQDAVFTLSLDKHIQGGFTVDYATQNGTANSGNDYTTQSGNLVFSGNNSQTHQVVVAVSDDAVVEASENFMLDLSCANALVNVTPQATASITDNDGTALLSISDVSFDENGSGTFQVSVDKAVEGGFDVDYTLVSNQAIAGTDFVVPVNRTLSFDGSANQTINFTIAATDDNIVEIDEVFDVTLSTTHALVDASATAVGTIRDNDAANISVADLSVTEGETASFELVLSNNVANGVVVDYLLEAITATSVDDYTVVSGQRTFTGTQNELITIDVNTIDDAIVEQAESFRLSLSTSNALVTIDNEAVATINDNDGNASVTVNAITIDEANNAVFTLVLNTAIEGGFSVDYATADGSAVSGSDYLANSGTINFNGDLNETQTVSVTVNDDIIVEENETFVLDMSTSNLRVDVPAQATATISDNDGVATLSINNAVFAEDGAGTYSVIVDKAVQGGFDVDFSLVDGSALAGVDYSVPANQTLNFDGSANQTVQFSIAAIEDNIIEPTENFTIQLSSLSTLVNTDAEASGEITDNDEAQITVTPVTVNEGEDVVYTLVLTREVVGGVNVDYSLSAVQATSDVDYLDDSGSVSFAGTEGEIKLITIATVDDAIVEGQEGFELNLSTVHAQVNPTASTLASINDNDGQATVTINTVTVNEGEDAILTLSSDKAVQGGFDISYSTADATANAGTDYNTIVSSIHFDGTLSETETITLFTIDDAVVEADETFNVQISTANPLIATSGIGEVTISNNDGVATLIVGNATVSEGGTNTISLSLDKEVQGDVVVNYTFNDVTTDASTDYDATGGSVTLSGTTPQTFTVTANHDALVEGSETFTVAYTTSSPLVVSDAESTVTIIDEDTANLLVEDVVATEGNDMVFTVTLSEEVVGGLTVDYTIVPGTASISDYSDVTGGTLTFVGTANETQQFTISTSNDGIVEGVEDFTVTLTSSKALVEDDDTATGTINDANGRATITVADLEINENEQAVFTLTLDKLVQGGVSVNYSTSDIEAIAGSDYDTQLGSIDFDGLTVNDSKTITIDVTDDAIVETSEAFALNLTTAHALLDVPASAEASIVDNDGLVALSVSDVSLAENGQTTVTVTSDKAIQGGFELDYMLNDGTAIGDTDYENVPSTIYFAGTVNESQEFVLRGIDDDIVEGDENFSVEFSSSNALVDADATITATITDDDVTTVTVEDISISEDEKAIFTLSLSNDVVGGFDIAYTISEGTAIAGDDYIDASGTVTFLGNKDEVQLVEIDLVDDAVVELSESFTLNLSTTNTKVTPDAETTASIQDNDGMATVTINQVSVAEGDDAVLTVTLDKAVQGGFSVEYLTVDGVALGGSDYTTISDAVAFAGIAGETQEIRVSTIDDALVESSELFDVNISTVSTLVNTNGTGEINITDNDGLVSLIVENVSFNEVGQTTVVVTADKAIQGGFEVDYVINNGTAISGVDFDALPSTLYFVGTENESQEFIVSGIDDDIVEGDEQFTIDLSSSNSLVDADASIIATITDDDVTTVSVNSVIVSEGDKAVFALTLSNDVIGGFELDYNLSAATAIAGDDYVDASGIVTFIGNRNEVQLIEIDIVDDEVVELLETFTLNLSSTNTKIIPDAETIATINDNDGIATVTIDQVSVVEGEEAVLTLSLDKGVQDGFTIDYLTVDGTALSVGDYTSISDAIIFTGIAGETQEIRVATIDDVLVEPTELLNVSISTLSTLVSTSGTGEVSISDNDGVAKLVFENQTVNEGESLNFTLSLDKAVQGDVEITYSFVDGSAIGGSDYDNTPSSITLIGTEAKTITVATNPDDLVEGFEDFTINFASTSSLVNTDDQASITINDEDATSLLIDDVTIDEGGKATFTVSLSKGVTDGFTVDYSVNDESAVAGVDYTAASGQLTFTGATNETHSFEVQTLEDDLVEGAEYASIQLSASNSAVDASREAHLNITDNDSPGWIVEETDAITITSEAGISDVFTVVLEAQPQSDVVVEISGLDETEGSLSATSLTFTSATWDEVQTVTVTGIDDDEVDGNITYTLNVAVNDALSDVNFHGLSTNISVSNNDNDVFNPVPVLVDDEAETLEDESIDIDVLANDSGLEDTPININLVAQPANAFVSLNGDKTFRVAPNANFNGVVTFDYQVCDVENDCAIATVTLTVNAVNDAPTLNNDNIPVSVQQGETVQGSNLLVAATDVEGDVITINITPTTAPLHGTLTINADGTYEFIADADYVGNDFFEYSICDNGTPQACVTGRVSLTITEAPDTNEAPIAVDDVFEMGRNEVLSGQNLLDNDSDPNGDMLVINVLPLVAPANGQVLINSDGSFEYTPNADFTGDDFFTYQVCDDAANSKCAVANVDISVSVKDTDGDTLPDDIEGDEDVDGDGEPNYLDLDSDGDGISDREEGLGDCDEDGVANFIDADQCYDDLPLSKGFSPNNDGINDEYVIPWLDQYKKVSFEVFNRWGNVIYKMDVYDNSWNGTANVGGTIGEDLPVGTYFYIITVEEINQQFNGYIYLNR